MAIGPLPPVISEIQANSGQPGKMLARQQTSTSLLDLQAEAATPLATNILPETTLLEDAVAAALGRQGGLADLYATLTQLSVSPDLPDKVKAAIAQVLAFQLGDGDVTPERLAQAIRSSGLFHEAVVAGKMMAALPQAVRQALGKAADGSARAQVSSPPRGAPSQASQTSPQSPAAAPERPGGALASAIASYGRASGTSAQPGAPQTAATSSAPTSAATTPPSAATPAAAGSSPTPAVSSLATMPTQVAPSAGQPLPVVGEAPAAPPQTTSPSVSVASQPVQTAAPMTGGGSSPTPTGQPPASSSTPQPAPSTSQTIAAGAPPTQTSTPTAPSPTTVPPQVAAPSSQQVGPSPTPTAGQTQTTSTTSAPGTAAPAPSASALSAPESAPAAQSSGKSFAPWTPGRPMTPSPTPTQPSLSTGTPTPQSPTTATTSTATNVPAHPEGEAPAAARPAADRALFVPSSIDSLPSRPVGTLAATAPASSPPTAGTPAQPGAAPTGGQAQMTSQPSGLSTSQIAAQPPMAAGTPVVAPSQQPATATPTTSSAAPAPSSPAAPSPPPSAPARPVSGSPAPATQQAAGQLPVGLDLKGAIDLLRRELIVWLGRSADVMASADGADDATTARVDRPAPPRRNGPLRGQPAVDRGAEALDALSTEALAGRALGEAERSLSRVFLHQAATAETRDPRAQQAAQAMMLEIPIAGPNGVSIAQLRIERDEHPPSEPGAPPRRVFQVDVAFDIAPLGPVVVRVGLMDGRRVAIGVWCETDDGLVRMEAERSNIVIGLEAEGMTVAGVDLHKGHPPEGGEETATVARNHRLDLQL